MDIERRRQEAAEYRRKPRLIEDDEIPEGIIKASQHSIEEEKEPHKDKFIIERIDRRHRREVHYSQIGGLAPLSGNGKYPAAVTGRTQSYTGCVRDLFINNELYDLGVPDFASNEHTQMGCDLSEAVCDLNSIRGGYCIHGECIADAVMALLSHCTPYVFCVVVTKVSV
ncbi:Cadherin-related hmr-1 [Toxocara canis]|uniref:Cadherin-related hmr-1 n=1 Tax=Toxocara canis TaxID=6265 RepID=A0A0B2UN32_TOXCA|nr:Cadherin-related hmr-1 [Toxocara canis]